MIGAHLRTTKSSALAQLSNPRITVIRTQIIPANLTPSRTVVVGSQTGNPIIERPRLAPKLAAHFINSNYGTWNPNSRVSANKDKRNSFVFPLSRATQESSKDEIGALKTIVSHSEEIIVIQSRL